MRIKTYLKMAGVPEAYHADARHNLRKAAFKFMLLVLPMKIVASLGLGFLAGITSKRGAQQPRKALAWFGNNISINGDRGPWSWKTRADGVPYSSRDPVPERTMYRRDDDGSDTLFNYYWRPGKVYAENPVARGVWLTRNPASRFAQILGAKILPTDKVEPGATSWSEVMKQWFYDDGAGTQIWVIEYDGTWSIRFRRRTRLGIWISGGYGYKLNNVGSDYHCLDPNMEISVSHIALSCSKPKAGSTIIGVIK